MLLGTVEGNIWSTKKSPGLFGKSFLTVRVGEQFLICADCVGAGSSTRFSSIPSISSSCLEKISFCASIRSIFSRKSEARSFWKKDSTGMASWVRTTKAAIIFPYFSYCFSTEKCRISWDASINMAVSFRIDSSSFKVALPPDR